MSDSLFELNNVAFRYSSGRQSALTDFTLSIERGEQLALVGANGSGKSTLLRLLCALDFATSGTVLFEGQELTPELLDQESFFFPFRKRVGYVFQDPDIQLFNASVFDDVAFGPLHLRLPQAEVRRRVEQTLESGKIAHLRDRSPHRLSGGEKKRVALASVLVMDPEILLLDEPAGALDPAAEAAMLETISGWRGTGRTVVMSTHNLASLEDIADRCCVLREGRLLASAKPLDVLHNGPLLESAGLLHRHRHHHHEPPGPDHPHAHR